MAKEEVSKIYGKPNFTLIVGMFAVSIVVLLTLGWFFLRSNSLKLKTTNLKRSGMALVYTAAPMKQ